jgi:hypothetical protein
MCAHLDSSFHYALTRLVVCAFGTFFPFDNVVGVSVFAPLDMSFQHVSVCWCVSVFVFWCVSAFLVRALLDLSFRCVLYQFRTEFMLLGGCVHVVATTSSLDIQKRTIMYCLYKLHTILSVLVSTLLFTPRCHHHVVIHLAVDNSHHAVTTTLLFIQIPC